MPRPTILLLCLLSAGTAIAQNRANFPWWNSPIVSDPALAITPEQNQKIRQIVRSYRPRLLDARNTAQKAEGDLEDLLNDPDVNPDVAKPVIEKVASARANANRIVLEMAVQMRSVLTLDQWRVVVRRWDEQQKRKPSDLQAPPP